MEVRYDIDMPALVSLGATGPLASTYGEFVSGQLRDTSGNVDYWNGRDSAGNIVVSADPVVIEAKTVRLPENILAIEEKTLLDIAILKSDPYVIRPLYNEQTQITYSISESANVTVKILSQNGSEVIRVLENGVSKAPGTYTVSWDGLNASGEAVAEEGDYRVRVEAVDSYGATKIRDGNIRIIF